MSKEETFYKLKYPTIPDAAQVEELKGTTFGAFVLFTLGTAVLDETEPTIKDRILKRIEKDPFTEMGEFFNDLSQTRVEDIGGLRQATLNEFIKLMVIADEMENG